MADVTTIVVLAALQQQAERAAVAADPQGGTGTFVPGIGLRAVGDDTNTIKAYWSRWNMKAGQQGAFATALGGPVSVYLPGQSVHLKRDRWMFNSNTGWAPHEVLAALGLTTLIPEE